MNSIQTNQPSGSVLREDQDFFIQDHAKSGSKELPFANYLAQSIYGINDGVLEATRGYQELAFGKGPGLQNVGTADFETHFLLYLASGVATNLTKAATTLFQMQV